jgi:hypothetical protein
MYTGLNKGCLPQKLLQVDGDFKPGDKHPNETGLVFMVFESRKSYPQRWGTQEQFDNNRAKQAEKAKKRRRSMGVKPKYWNQTDYSTIFKLGDLHPTINGLRFFCYSKLSKINNIKREQWLTEEQFNRREVQRKSARKRQDQKDKKREWRLNNLDKEREYRNRSTNKRSNDPQFKILKSLHSRLYTAVKNQGAKKSARTLELADCTAKFLCNHLESQFTEGMTWDNMGRGGWHIDHIIPCAFFDLTKPSHQKVCFNWQNLQPLWESDNCAKGDKIPWYVLLTILMNNYKTITL